MYFVADDPVLNDLCEKFHKLRIESQLLSVLFKSVRSADISAQQVPLVIEEANKVAGKHLVTQPIVDYCTLVKYGLTVQSHDASSGFMLTPDTLHFTRQLITLIDSGHIAQVSWWRAQEKLGDVSHFSTLWRQIEGYQTRQVIGNSEFKHAWVILADLLVSFVEAKAEKALVEETA